MTDDQRRILELRLVPVAGPPDAAVIDDILRLIRQANATMPQEAAVPHDAPPPRLPTDDEQRDGGFNELEARIKHRIEQASRESQAAVEQRAEVAKQPDAATQLATQARQAAERLVAAVQRAALRGVVVRVPDA